MPDVDYEDALDGSSQAPPAAPRSVYDDILDKQDQDLQNRVVQSIAQQATKDPNAAAAAQKLAAQTGVGPDLASRNMTEMRRQAAVLDAQQRQLASSDPVLATQLTDPHFSAIAHDDLDNLSTAGRLFKGAKETLTSARDAIAGSGGSAAGLAFSLGQTPEVADLFNQSAQGEAEYKLGMLGIKAKRGQASADDWRQIRDLQQQIKTTPEPQTFFGRTFGGVAGMAGNLLPMVPHSLVVGAVGAGLGASVGAPILGVGSVPGAVSGFGAGVESEFGAQSYEMMAGQTYLDLLDKGVDPERAQWAAGAVGAVNTALQLGALRLAGKPLAGAASRMMSSAMGEEIAAQMVRPTVGAAVKKYALNWAKNTAIGTGEMTAQTLASAMGEGWAEKENPFTPELGKRLGQSAVEAALTMGSINAFTGMAGYGVDLARADKAERSAQFFEALNKNATDSAVRERNPDAYERYIGAQAAGGPAEHVYIDGQNLANVLNQSGIEPAQLEKSIPGITAQLGEAAATGGDVAIPTAQYAARLAGTPLGDALKDHLRLDPDAMSVAEASEWRKNQAQTFQEMQQRGAEKMAGDAVFAASAGKVESDVYDQIRATGTVPADVARTDAMLMREMVMAHAAELGVTPEEFYERFKPSIERAATRPEADALQQGPAPDGTFYQREPGDEAAAPGNAPGNALRGRKARNLEAARMQGELLKGGAGNAAPPESQTQARGGFDPSRMAILLDKKADFSTFAHEMGHYYLSVLSELAKDPNAPGRYKHDMDTLLGWFGVKDHAAWDAMSVADQRKHHEAFAYNFEQYLAEGKAPSLQLQGIFDRFSSWLKRVYASIKDDLNTTYRRENGTDLPIMKSEVRAVMDRMLASDEQIRHAESVRDMRPLFDKKPETMTPEQWVAYQDMSRDASDTAASDLSKASVRQMQWLQNARSKALKAIQDAQDVKRQGVRAEIKDEMAQEPLAKAKRFLKSGELEDENGEQRVITEGNKLDADRVKGMYGDSALGEKPDLGRLRGMTAKGALDPDLVANMFGFDNGDQLIRTIAGTDEKAELERRTDQRMLERYGEIDPEAEVNKALHNEARQRFVAVELRHLSQATEPVRLMQRAAQQAAESIIAGKNIAEINPNDHVAAEARAARAAEGAMKRGDSAEAAKQKRNQLLQNALATAALKAREEVQQTLKKLDKYDQPSTAITKAIGADYMDRIDELLAGYNVKERSPVNATRTQPALSRWVDDEYDRTGIMPAVSDDLVARLGTMSWRDMTLGQLRDLRDAVASLDHIGRQRTEIEIEGVRQSVDELIGQVHDTLKDVKHTEPVDVRPDLQHATGLNKLSAQWLNAKGAIKSLDAAVLKMEQFFQWLDAGKDAGVHEAPINGPMQKLFRLASGAEAKERGMRAESSAAMRELGEKLRDTKIDLNESLDVPELPRRNRGTQWYREELIAMALNMGNESNKEKLLRGYQWQEMDAVAAMNRLLSPDEMNFVQGMWDHINSYGQEIVDLQRRQTGVTPKMIEPATLSTAHGTFHGGYYPVVYDAFLDKNIEQKQAENADRLFENNYANPSTSKGHTIARTNYDGPIYLSLSVIARHIDQVTHDLAWREAITNMNKVLMDPRLQEEIDQTYGREYSKQLRPWLQSMANDRVFNTAGDAGWEALFRKVRSNATMVGIGFRLSTIEVHGATALSNSIGEVGAKWFAKGVQQFTGIDRVQQTRDFVYARSPEMANRMNEADRNLHEAIDEINAHQSALVSPGAIVKTYDAARKFAYRGVMISDMASALPTWMGAYLKGMAKDGDGGLNLSEQDAIEYANRAVRNAHGGGGTKDLSAVQRDKGALSLATMFYSYWNHVYNRQRDLGKGWASLATGQSTVRDFPRLLARSWFYFVVPQIAHVLLKPNPKEDDGTLKSTMMRLAEDIPLGLVSGVPVLRDLAAAAVNGRDYSFTPLEQAGKSLVQTARDAYKVSTGQQPSRRGFQNAAETAGYAFGLPLSQPAATAKFFWDVYKGDADPEGLKDWWQGVMTGRIK
jgi:hypothetical protein